MESTQTEEAPKVDVKEPVKPIGEVIIGNTDPRSLTEEQFINSPDILYHGTEKPFDFSKNFDYIKFDSPHTRTLGAGFYVTPDQKDAELFSEAFGAHEPLAIPFLPYKARMFDFRAEGGTGRKNAPVPVELMREWAERYKQFYDSQYADYAPGEDKRLDGVKLIIMENFTRYLTYINRLVADNKPVDLRAMMGIDGDQNLSEMTSHLLKPLMVDRGFDGIIYIEGGDHPEHRNTLPATYVFYNLDKIGTYKAWHDTDSE